MRHITAIFFYLILSIHPSTLLAEDTLKLDTAIIRGDAESPAILYIVPWKEIRSSGDEYQGLIIDDLQESILMPTTPGNELLLK